VEQRDVATHRIVLEQTFLSGQSAPENFSQG
jgi:hypothetical protein